MKQVPVVVDKPPKKKPTRWQRRNEKIRKIAELRKQNEANFPTQ